MEAVDESRLFLPDGRTVREAEAHLPTDTRGKPRLDDRRVISDIIHVIKSGGRWVDAPVAYGPRKTLYNRFQRWAAKGVWSDIFHALAGADADGPPAQLLIDSSAVRAHRCAAGGKGGTQSCHRSITRRTHHQDPCSDRRLVAARRLYVHRGQVADCKSGEVLLEQMPETGPLLQPRRLPQKTPVPNDPVFGDQSIACPLTSVVRLMIVFCVDF